jgi:oxysterol-binding protein 1
MNTYISVLIHPFDLDYRHQDDETVASRGSISMRTAIIKASSNEKTRFEVHSTPSRAHSSIQKWFIKANHPVEAARWIQAIERSIEWHKRVAASTATSQSSLSERDKDASSLNNERQSMDSDFRAPSIHRSITNVHRVGTFDASSIRSMPLPFGRGSIGGDYAGSVIESEPSSVAPALARMTSENDDRAGDDTDSGSVNEVLGVAPPHEGSFSLQGNALGTQVSIASLFIPRCIH